MNSLCFILKLNKGVDVLKKFISVLLGVLGTAFLIKPLLTVVVDDEDESVDEDRTNEQF